MAEKRTIELEVKESGFKSLKAQLREAQADVAALSEKFGTTSKEATDAAKAAGILKDKIADAKDLTDAFNPDAKFNALSSSIGGVLNGFQAYEGAMGLIGVESEDLQKTLLKVQSAMALSQGIQGALEAKDSFVQLGAVVKTAFNGMTTASKAFMVGGIGLLIGAIGLLVANWDNLTNASIKTIDQQKKYSEEAKKLNEVSKQNAKQIASESSAFVGLVNQLRATNANTKERKNLINEINSKYGITLKNLKDESAFQIQLNSAINEYINFQRLKLTLSKYAATTERLLTEEILLQTKLNKLKDPTNLEDYRKRSVDGQKKINEEVANYETRLEEISFKLSDYGKVVLNLTEQTANKYIPTIEKTTTAIEKNATAVVDLTKQSEEEALKIKQKAADDWLDTIEKIQEENYLNTLTEKNKDIQLVEDKYFELESLAIGNAEQEVIIAEAKANELLDIDKKYAVATVELETKTAEEIAAEKTKNFQAGVDLTIKYLQTFADVTNSINSLMNANDSERLKNENITAKESEKIKRRMFDRDKKLRIVQTIIDTASNVVQSVRNGGGIPTGIPFGIAAGAMGALQVAAISKTTFDSGGGGGGGGNIGGGTPTAPNFNIVGNSGINQLAELGGQPIQAYVVSGEVTSAQALDRNRIQNATF